jgi:hypothetical protein
MEQLVELFVNNGVAVAVVIYFLARDWKFNDELHKTLTTLIDTVDALKDVVDIRVEQKRTYQKKEN